MVHADSQPSYFDLQVNGYAGVDFNGDDWTLEQLLAACRRLRPADGVAGILATIITAEVTAMCRRLQRLVDARQQHAEIQQMIAGFHLEGPFLNETRGYIGAHPAAAAQSATVSVMQRLLDATQGLTRIVTLAPERDPEFAVTRMLVERGVTVSAGHCNPPLELLDAAIDAGLSMVTHLGNGCPLELHRHDNFHPASTQPVRAALDRLHRRRRACAVFCAGQLFASGRN